MPLWGGCDKEDINSLQVLQIRAAQIVTRDYLQEQTEKRSFNKLVGYRLNR